MPSRPETILALQFKYFGDAVLMTPALRALCEHFPQSEIHLLVPAEIAPLFQHLPRLKRVWAMPRRRGSADLREAWPLIRALRREKFDRSVDFAGNDRGAILSRRIGARHRLARAERGGSSGRNFCYTERVAPENNPQHESRLLVHILSAWLVPPPASFAAEIHTDPALGKSVMAPFPRRTVLCHVTTTNYKKQWPVGHRATLHQLASAVRLDLMFSTGRGSREQQVLAEIERIVPAAPVLPPDPNLATFLVWLKQSAVFISGDTGPLHYAAALGVRTIGLFGPSSAARWAPIGEEHEAMQGARCTCDVHLEACQSARPCIAAISPAMVLERLQKILVESAR
jgi:ADP-heptose:LPS heptosyltransferase